MMDRESFMDQEREEQRDARALDAGGDVERPSRAEFEEETEERFGAGVCLRGDCVEPCGEFGGCRR